MTTEEICSHCGTDHFPEPCPAEGLAIRAAQVWFTLPVGSPVGEYRVTGPLGKGGMGVVYAGVHPLLGRKVAIKVLIHQGSQSDEASARFLQEARAASTLRHTNIVDVFAFGQLTDGRYYQVMELLEGESLRSILDRCGSLPPRPARAIIAGVLNGLSAAHRRGVVHRDIKPDNVFICGVVDGAVDGELSPGDVKILDFGVAKHDTGERASVKTRTGAALGTPAYMSPEQCRGVATVDGRTDIYATGVMLFEMLVGHTPFQSESAFDVMAMQINARLPSVAKLIGREDALEPVITRALEKRAEERYGTASEMLAAVVAASSPANSSESAAEGGQERARLPRGFADRATVPAVAAQAQGEDGLGRSAERRKSDPTASVATFTGGAWRTRGVPYLAAGAALGLLVVGASLLFSRARRPAEPRATEPRGPAPTAVSITPLPPPAASATASAPPAPPPAAKAATKGGTRTASKAPSTKLTMKPAAKPARRPATKPIKKIAGAHGSGHGNDVDLDIPINPYAR